MKNLTEFNKGDTIKIRCISCGQNFRRRLSELGLFDGAEIEVIKNDKWGPIIVKIFESKIALGRGEAQKIYGNKI